MPQRLVFAVHNHQPVGNFGQVFRAAYDRCYRPFLDLAAEFPKVKLTLHYTGSLLEWIEAERPQFLSDVRALVERGQVEILGGGFYEPMLAVLPDADARGQIARMQAFAETHFGSKPIGMWLAERVWDPDLPRVIAPTGTRYTLLDDAHFFAAGVPRGQLSGHFTTEKVGKTLSIFPIDRQLRYAIPWKPVPDVLRLFEQLQQARGDDPRCLTYGDDGEKFGLWPETYEWVYAKGWLRDFFVFLSERGDLVETVHPGAVLASVPPSGRVYLPTGSYEEMGEWSLPALATRTYDELKERLRGQGVYDQFQPFVRGGIWQGFFAKYPESNHLHKRVLRVSERLAALARDRPGAPELEEARAQLYRSECNCAYWHGVFGGLYLNNLRHALNAASLRSEHLLDHAEHGAEPFLAVEIGDLDADLREEVAVRTQALSVIVSPALGGSLIELSDYGASYALADVLSRRDEAYHDKLRELERGEVTESDGRPPGKDAVREKGPSLSHLLVFDDYRRTCFIDRLYDPDFQLAGLGAGAQGDLGSFGKMPYERQDLKGPLDGQRLEVALSAEGAVGGAVLGIEKRYQFTASRPGFGLSYALRNRGEERCRFVFASELNLTLLSGDATDRYLELPGERREKPRFRGSVAELRELALVDEWAGFRARVRGSQTFELWCYPVETISQSEGGFEKTYQGTCLLLRFPFDLAPGTDLELRLDFDLERLRP